jgi:hypothetical protein
LYNVRFKLVIPVVSTTGSFFPQKRINMSGKKIIIRFEVQTNFELTPEQMAEQLIIAENMLNEKTKLRWYVRGVTKKALKTFIRKG